MRLVIGREARAQGYPVQDGEETVGGMIEKSSGNWIYFFYDCNFFSRFYWCLVVVGGSWW